MAEGLKKVEFKTDGEVKDDTVSLVADLLKEKSVKSLISKGRITTTSVKKYPYRIRQWLTDYAPCLGCKSLASCHQKTHGYYQSLVDDGILHTEISPCLYMRRKLAEEAHLQNYVISNLTENLKTVSFADIDSDAEDDTYLNTMLRLQKLSEQNKGAYIYGTMGVGKTYLAACAANAHAKKGDKIAFVHYPTFLQRMNSLIPTNEWADLVKKLTYVDFLVIDDIGAEKCTEWNRDQILQPILVYRFDNHLPTWFTSNYDLETLESHFMLSAHSEDETAAARIISRLGNMAEMVALTGEDRRKFLSNGI